MKNRLDKPLTRRAWMALTGAAVAGCGGGGSLLAALPGTGGTGAVFAQGTISGFGSVIVNGIKFDDLQASVSLDGSRATSTDLRLGMVAEIQGQRGADLTQGTAGSIDVWTLAQGNVTALISGGFVVSGMSIRCDAATVLDGVGSTGEIAVGHTLSVWGLQNRADASQWVATRVSRVTSGLPLVSTGLVQRMGTEPTLNGMLLMGDAAGAMMNGALVRVEGVLSAPGVVQVSKVRSIGDASMGQDGSSVEVEAYVTELSDATHFRLGLVTVDAASADMQKAASLALGDRVEVYGSWRSGVLVANRVAIETEQEAQATEISGRVSMFTSVADFVVRSERCNASQAVFSHGVASDLKQDAMVKLKGTRSGAVLIVDTVEFQS